MKSLFIVLLGCAISSAALAQSTKQRVDTLEQQVDRLQRTLENSQLVQTEMLQTIQSLQKDNQELRNELETLQFESGRSGDRQRELYLDLDTRLQSLESGRGSGGALTGPSGEALPDDKTAYQAAFDELKAGNYAEAGAGFEAFLAEFADSGLRDNAQYWLAETQYVRKNFDAALEGFQKVITAYPASRKLPDAWLKIGYCNFELENNDEARRALNTVISQHPESTAAKLARERLALMDTDDS